LGLLTRSGALLASPLLAVIVVFALKVSGWIVYFMPGLNRMWGWGRLGFLWAFSRLVVEDAPMLELPVWGRVRRG
jgi:hypothetical protein